MSAALALEADNPFRNTALITWPVRFDREHKSNIADPHVTTVFLPDITGLTPEDVLKAIRFPDVTAFNTHRIEKVRGVDAFGPNGEYPVLLINDPPSISSSHVRLSWLQSEVKGLLDDAKIDYDNTWVDFKPHVTCDIRTIINPPLHVILKPLELWWDGGIKYVV